MTFDNFTIKAQTAILSAQEYAKNTNHQIVDTAHLLKGILIVDENITPFLLKTFGVNISMLEKKIEAQIECYSKVGIVDLQSLSNDANYALSAAKRALTIYNDEFISIELVLYGILVGADQTARHLKKLGITKEGLKSAILDFRKGKRVTSRTTENQYNLLEKFATNLTEYANLEKLDPIIGRNKEMRKILNILSRRRKNNPIIIGKSGVGKTALVEGLALRIVNQDMPKNLKSKTIFSLDIAALIAGAKYKGDFEHRLKTIIKEVSYSNNIILFIDGIHTLTGAGNENDSLDAANILKPVLTRGELQIIGVTTLAEYEKFVTKNNSFARCFQTVTVDEPNIEDTISILRGLKGLYERHHDVVILDDALIAAAKLSKQYITDKNLPDKAIDLIDEAAAELRLEIDSLPEKLDELERKIRQLEIERNTIQWEDDKDKLAQLDKQIRNLTDTLNTQKTHWQSEKEIVTVINDAKNKIKRYKLAAEIANRNADFAQVAKLRYGKIKEQEEILRISKKGLHHLTNGHRLIIEEVTVDSIIRVIARRTGLTKEDIS